MSLIYKNVEVHPSHINDKKKCKFFVLSPLLSYSLQALFINLILFILFYNLIASEKLAVKLFHILDFFWITLKIHGSLSKTNNETWFLITSVLKLFWLIFSRYNFRKTFIKINFTWNSINKMQKVAFVILWINFCLKFHNYKK